MSAFIQSAKKFIYSAVTGSGTSGEGDGKKGKKKPKRSKSLENTTRQPFKTDQKSTTKNVEKKSELEQKADKSFNKIMNEYSNFNKKFLEISKNDGNNREVYLELIEELDQLVFALDKVEVGNYKELKEQRRDLFKFVQALIKKAKTKIQDNVKTETVTNESDVNFMDDFLKLGNHAYPNLQYDPQNNTTTNLPANQNCNFGETSNKISSHEPVNDSKMEHTSENPIVGNLKVENGLGCEIGSSNVGQDGVAGTDQPEPDVQQVQTDVSTPPEVENDEESMDFEVIESESQDNQNTTCNLPAAVNTNQLLQHASTVSATDPIEGNSNGAMITASGSMPAPIQLLTPNSEGVFELDEAAVRSVLCQDDVKNRKIAIVSVVGAFRRGKSFLLNFMLRYLKAQCHPDWLTQSDVVEGFSWRGGKERDTTGILMWPEVFLVGENLALILLDTQGTFDKKTSMKENTFIFALSTLLSSVQIYNLHERIQMDDLNNLQYFLEFGRMVETACNTKVFEDFIFLIRDWKHDTENEFGFDGGRQELREWFDMDHNSVTKQQAEMIDTCFKRIECFLMPNPGEKVATSLNFTGTLTDIRENFLEYLKLFIETVLRPDNLAVKQIGGEYISAQDLLAYMKNYVEKLQHPDLEPKTLFQSMSETCHEKVMSEAKLVYMREMETGLMDVAVDIQVLHQSALTAAGQVFDNAPKFGSDYNTNTYRKKLVEYLNELYGRYSREFELQNESRFHSACSEIYETFQTTLTSFCMQLHSECTLEEKCKEACKHAVDTLVKLKLRVSEEVFSSKYNELVKKIKHFYEQQIPFFKARQEFMHASKTKEQYNEIKQKVVKCYQQTMDLYCGGPELVPDFDEVHSRAEFKAHKLMYADMEEYQLTDCNQLQLEINQEIEEICKRFRSHDKRKIEKKEEDEFQLLMVKCHQLIIDMYRRLMDEQCGGLKTVENIDQLHKAANKEALALLTPHFKVYRNLCQPYHKNSKEAIANLFTQYKHNNEEKLKHNARERACQLFEKAYQTYEEQMGSLQIGTIPIENLYDEHAKIWEICFNVLDPITSSEFYTEVMQNLRQRVSQRFTYYTQINNARLRQAELEHRKLQFDESIKYYQDKMDGLEIDVRPVVDLEAKHCTIKNEAKNLLIAFCEMEDYDGFINNFDEAVEKKYKNYQEKNEKMQETFKNEEKRIVIESYNSMKIDYTSNMQRQMSAAVDTKNSDLLYEEHQKQKEICIATFEEMTSECSDENKLEWLEKLQHDMQTSYDDIEETYAKNLRDLRVKEEELREGASKTYAIGIDLGTTNCCAAVCKDGVVEIILNSIDKNTTPSVVCFKDNEIVFGETAVKAGVAYPENCISEMKRIIGRTYDDPVVQARMQKWHFKVENSKGMPSVKVTRGSKSSYKPEEISALVLGEMKRIAEVYLGSKVHDAVVTIPAYFNELQRKATKAACEQAGLNVLRMLNEPTAAAIAFGLQCKTDEKRTVLVFDFGGGTCDISIMTIEGKNFTVIASKGDNVLGGEDFDDRLTDHVSENIEGRYDIKIDNSGRRRLRIACETAKKKLSEVTEYKLEVDEFIYDGNDKIDVQVTIKKEDFESLTKDLVERALVPVKECLLEAKMTWQDIVEVVLVGGSSKLPKIQELLKNFFQGKKLNMKINPDEAIAYGAAIQAAVSCGDLTDYKIQEITPISLGIGIANNRMSIIIPKNSKVPVSKTEQYVTVYDNQDSGDIKVYQGEHTKDETKNTRLGKYRINGMKMAPAGKTKVDVTFTIDADGILHTSVVEVGNSDNKVSLTIDANVL